MNVMGGKNTISWKERHYNKKKKHMHIGKELEAHQVEKRRWSWDSDAPQVGSARSDSTGVVKVNRRETNRRKTRPYSIFFL
jgi:hypothetical protein